MSKYRHELEDFVTIYGRKQVRPELDVSTRRVTSDIPETIYFRLPNGSKIPVDSRKEIIIGRQPRPDDPPVTVDLERFKGREQGVSRHHALIKLFKDALILVDLDSINGTYVNGRRALPLKRYPLIDGDEITVGRVTITINYSAKR